MLTRVRRAGYTARLPAQVLGGCHFPQVILPTLIPSGPVAHELGSDRFL